MSSPAHRLMLVVLCTLPVACEPPQTTREAIVPSVKTIVLQTEIPAAERTLSGTLIVGDETRLGFAIGGKLLAVPLREGEAFEAGQVIARLDPANFERSLAAAKTKLAAARSRLAVAQENFRRQTELERKGVASRAQLERATAEFESARSEARVAEVSVADAEEQLRKTRLVASRDGIVTRLRARKLEEIQPGDTVYEVGAQDAMEVSVLVPEQLIPAIAHGGPVSVTIPGLGDTRVDGRITEIGAVAEAGNAFRLKARLDRLPAGARSGMTATVRLEVAGNSGPLFAIPISALAFDSTSTEPTVGSTATIFLLDEEEQVVRRHPIPVAGVIGNRVLVSTGLEQGQQVVVAGVALLRDGQPARRWTRAE